MLKDEHEFRSLRIKRHFTQKEHALFLKKEIGVFQTHVVVDMKYKPQSTIYATNEYDLVISSVLEPFLPPT